MKKTLAVVGVLAAAVLVFSLAHAQFGGVKVPGVGKVTTDVAQMEYDQCKTQAEQYRNNLDYNSTNIENALRNNKDFTIDKYSKDWRRGGSKWDKENKRLELSGTFRTQCNFRASCTQEKCSTFYCSKK